MKNGLYRLACGFCILLSVSAHSASFSERLQQGWKEPAPQIVNVYSRSTISLNGAWNAIVDQFDTGYYDYQLSPKSDRGMYFADRSFYSDKTRLCEYDFNRSMTLNVPGDWNTQQEKLYYYEGTIWYRKKFDFESKPSQRVFLYFGAANYETLVGINGIKVGFHEGGYSPFNFEVTRLLKEKDNSLIVHVDNTRRRDAVPTLNMDWMNYGGITRDVMLVVTPETFIREYSVQIGKDCKTVYGYVRLDGSQASQRVFVDIPELNKRISVHTDANGYAEFRFKASPQLWSPESPKLYDVILTSETDCIKDRVGFRTIQVQGHKILLNGKEIFLKGVAVHEEAPFGQGRAFCREHDQVLIKWAKEMNCNFLRLAHYPHNEDMIRLADEEGLLLWSEIPCYWSINWNSQDTYRCAESQLKEMITRDRNRASVIFWSVANETPRSSERLDFLSRLISVAREMDGTRLVSAAMEKRYVNSKDGVLTVDDELLELTDVISFNQYVGWYDGNPDKCDKVTWCFPVDKPVVVTEFGGGAVYGNHGQKNEFFSEEYLEYLYEKNLQMFSRIDQLCGLSPWCLVDFRSTKRMLSGVQDEYNRKGLVSDNGGKKKAYYVMRKFYENR